MCLLSAQAGEKGWKTHSAWSRLYCCLGILPGKWSLKSVPHLSPDFTTCGILKNYLSLLKYLLPLFCQDPGYEPLSKSVLRT